MLLVYQANLNIVERTVSKLLAHAIEGILELILQAFGVGTAICGAGGSHPEWR